MPFERIEAMSQIISMSDRRWWNCLIYRNTYMDAEENAQLLDNSSQRRFYARNTFHIICLIFLGSFFLLGLSIGTYLLFNDGRPDIPDNFIIVTRTFWDVQLPTRNVSKLIHPIENILFTSTDSDICVEKLKCIEDLRDIQIRQRNILGEREITYNFFAGGDGRIYEGRGWRNMTSRQYFNREVLLIALSGTFKEETPLSANQVESVVGLLVYGIATNKLHPCFQVLKRDTNTTYLADVICQIENTMRNRNLC